MDKHKLLKAYTALIDHLYEVMDDTLHSFAEALDISKEKVRQVGDLTHEELEKVSGFVKRDVEHAVHKLTQAENKQSLSEWFKFDIELLENFALDAFLSIADKTRIELAKLGERAKVHSYHSGEITMPGTFVCDACGKEIAFKTASEIPKCPACHKDKFVRV